jgi:signal transduction histidine kinase
MQEIWRSSSLRATLAILLVSALAAAGLAAAIIWQTGDVLQRRNEARLLAETRDLGEIAARDGLDALRAALERRQAASDLMFYGLATADGRPEWTGRLDAWPAALARDNAAALFEVEVPADRPGGGPRLALGATLRLPDGARLLVARDVTEQKALLHTIRDWSLATLGAMTLLALLAGWAINRALTARLEAMSHTAREIMAGDLTRRIPVSPAGDEFDALAGDLNAMLGRIERLMAGLREVSDNIAHDLKTPLSRLRISAEEALRDPAGDAACREGLERVLVEADELMRTFNALLQVARLEAGTLPEHLERFDLARMIADIAEFYDPVIDEAGAHLEIEGDATLEISANRQLISQALTNLIENALKYGLDHARDRAITIGAAATSAAIEIWVADRGTGIRDCDRERVLDRFVRLDAARSKPGTGIGLSLVAAVAAQHGGDVRLLDNRPGLRVVIRLPRDGTMPVMLSGAGPARVPPGKTAGPPVDESQPSTVNP